MRRITLLLVVLLLAGTPFPASGAEGEMQKKGAAEAGMMLHHLHIMMNHGITMVTEGSNLVMIAGMKMTRYLDGPTKMHGQTMIAKGTKIIQRSLGGSEIKELMKGELADSPPMQYTLTLGNAMLDVIGQLGKMDIEHMSSARSMSMHHMHIALNHAPQMAAQGASLIMLGKMGMAGKVDKFSLDHGRAMVSDARALFTETMEGEEMKFLRGMGATPENSTLMRLTYDLADAISKVISLLEEMPG